MDKDIRRIHNRLRKDLKKTVNEKELLDIRTQLFELAQDWKQNQTDTSITDNLKSLESLVTEYGERDDFPNNLHRFLSEVLNLVVKLNALSLISLEISDKLAVSGTNLTGQERDILNKKKTKYNELVKNSIEAVNRKVSTVTNLLCSSLNNTK